MAKTLEILDGTLSNTLHGNTKNTIDKFWSLVDVRGKDECWLWTRPLAAKKEGYSYSKLAAKYNVSKTTIAYAVRGGTWNE